MERDANTSSHCKEKHTGEERGTQMKFEFEYGQGTMAANLPDNTDVFIPGRQ